MIMEYLDPGPAGRQLQDRYIPIRGRNEFLPSVARVTASSPEPAKQQLDLPFKQDSRTDNADRPTRAKPLTPTHDSKPAADVVIRFPSTARETVSLPLKPPQQFGRKKQKFTIGGFLVGCAMGSAAAVLALLVLQTVVG